MSPWQQVKDSLDLVEVMQDYVSIKSKSGNYTCLCPFHQEKTPSLIISSSKQIWHCFGCGAGGDVFAFVSQIENISKLDALRKLAGRAGVELKNPHPNSKPTAGLENKETPQVTEPNETIDIYKSGQKMLIWTAELYHKLLLKILQDRNHPVTKYCLERGLTLEVIKQFKIGFAPQNNFLLEVAKTHNLDQNLLLETGLLRDNTK